MSYNTNNDQDFEFLETEHSYNNGDIYPNLLYIDKTMKKYALPELETFCNYVYTIMNHAMIGYNNIPSTPEWLKISIVQGFEPSLIRKLSLLHDIYFKKLPEEIELLVIKDNKALVGSILSNNKSPIIRNIILSEQLIYNIFKFCPYKLLPIKLINDTVFIEIWTQEHTEVFHDLRPIEDIYQSIIGEPENNNIFSLTDSSFDNYKNKLGLTSEICSLAHTYEVRIVESKLSEIIGYSTNGINSKIFHFTYNDNRLHGSCIVYHSNYQEQSTQILESAIGISVNGTPQISPCSLTFKSSTGGSERRTNGENMLSPTTTSVNNVIKKSEESYYYGTLEGTCKYYYPNGEIQYIKNYHNGSYHGYIQLNYPTGQCKYRKEYKIGKLEGINTEYSQSGKLIYRADIHNNELHGLVELWYEDNFPIINGYPITKIRSIYQNNVLNGIYEQWYVENIKLASQKNYRNGEIHGNYKLWSYDGILLKTQVYSRNLLDGISEENYPNGKLKQKTYYNAGELNSIIECRDENNKLLINKTIDNSDNSDNSWIYLHS